MHIQYVLPSYAELLFTSQQVDSKATKLDKDMAMAIEEDDSRLASMKEKCSGVRIFHQLSLLSHHPKQKTGNPPAVSTVSVTLVRMINDTMNRTEGRMTSSVSSYQILTRALAQDMRGDTKLSAILWRERNDSPKSGLTSVRAHSLKNPPLDLRITVQDIAQNDNWVTLIISS
jgi:hypothetical protein